jgi:DNA topoisomerase IB
VAQILAAMIENRGIFDDSSPEIWFRLPGKLGKAQQEHLKTIPPIPPKWCGRVEVFRPNGKVFWVAYDKDGQRHHMYTKDWREQREHTKIVRVLRAMTAPGFEARMNQVVARDAKDPSLRELALATRILRQCPLRPGSKHSKHFGLTTLTNKHLRGNELSFVGKSGQDNVCQVDSAVRGMLAARSGHLLGISDNDLREYLQRNFGITTKDFRTMRANQIFFEQTRRLPPTTTLADRVVALNTIAREAAEQLNNTSTIAKASYISNVLQAAFLLSPETVQKAKTLSALLDLVEASEALAVLRGAVLQRALGKRVSTFTVGGVTVHI